MNKFIFSVCSMLTLKMSVFTGTSKICNFLLSVISFYFVAYCKMIGPQKVRKKLHSKGWFFMNSLLCLSLIESVFILFYMIKRVNYNIKVF